MKHLGRTLSLTLAAAAQFSAFAQTAADVHVGHGHVHDEPMRIRGMEGFLDYENGVQPSEALPEPLVTIGAAALPSAMLRPYQSGAVRVELNEPLLGLLAAIESPRVSLPLPDGRVLELAFVHAESLDAGNYTLVGQVCGVPASDVILSRVGDVMRLVVRDYEHNERFDIRYAPAPADGEVGHVLWRGGGEEGSCGNDAPGLDPQPAQPGQPGQGGFTPRSTADPINVIDVLVLVTTQAYNFLGSWDAVYAEANSYAADFNITCANSGSGLFMRIADVNGPGYSEDASGSTDLSRLASGQAPYFPSVPAYRTRVRADTVMLLRRSTWSDDGSGTTLGVAYRMTSNNTSSSVGFAVTAIDQGAPEGTFTHELGHNLGGCHHESQGGCSNPMTGSPHGYRWSCDVGFCVHRWRDTMAYNNNDRACSSNQRLPVYSNPNILVEVSGACPDFYIGDATANVASLVLNTRATASQWRIGSTRVWTRHNLLFAAGDGTHYRPFGRLAVAANTVSGDPGEAEVLMYPGAYNEAQNFGPFVVSRPCIVKTPDGVPGTIIIR